MIAPWVYNPVAMSVLATPTCGVVSSVAFVNCGWSEPCTEGHQVRRCWDKEVSWLGEDAWTCSSYMCISPADAAG